MNITYYPYRPIHAEQGHITVIETAIPEMYSGFLRSFREAQDSVKLSDEHFNRLALEKYTEWIGDLMLELDLDVKLKRLLLKHVLNSLDEYTATKLIDQARALSNEVLAAVDSLDIAMDVAPITEIDAIIKFSGLHFSPIIHEDIYGKIETLVKALLELNEQKLVVLTNVTHYLDVSQMQDLVRLINTTPLTFLIIEFSSQQHRGYFADCDYVGIDKDFLDSRD
ncbi:type II-A CRISPR-associated protein Csn2 [Lacticaseibacillus nasuensis]|uniref:type II-A CRISPR-associated protein Csn2 n=1 Tax=Lacticaseibacillus nasuensis TaxID=944671 RepID=UPI0022471808|nr:type II-A CRISPR-associated protein Csn2 [Lacticaseibacillus nasuensis]MCX2455097.1 type II-A CRISPR-associated protein Csn2 [Lacticaseibacillus nasuensis]